MGCLKNKRIKLSRKPAAVAKRKAKMQLLGQSLQGPHHQASAEGSTCSELLSIHDDSAIDLIDETPVPPDQVNRKPYAQQNQLQLGQDIKVAVHTEKNPVENFITIMPNDHDYISPRKGKKGEAPSVVDSTNLAMVDHTYTKKGIDQPKTMNDSSDGEFIDHEDTLMNGNNESVSNSTHPLMETDEDEELLSDSENESQYSSSDNTDSDSDYEESYENGDTLVDASLVKNSQSITIEDDNEDEEIQTNLLIDNNNTANAEEQKKETEDYGCNDIVDVNYFLNQLQMKFKHHKIKRSAHECMSGMNDILTAKRTLMGLRNHIWLRCGSCKFETKIWTTPYKTKYGLEIHQAAVVGTLTSGTGYATLQELLASMNVRVMTEKIYIKHRRKLAAVIKSLAKKEMAKAAQEEYRLAVEAGDVTPDGYAKIRVISDMQWSKRSYRNGGYNALSGTAVIIGARTGKVLHCAIYNKACDVCARAKKSGVHPRPHPCDRNWDGTSTGMEPAGVLKGFLRSAKKYKLIYETLICDGDSSIMDKINEARPYAKWGIEVNKIECKNHLFRNLGKKLSAISEMPMPFHPPKSVCFIGDLRAQIKETGHWMRIVIEEAMIARMEENVSHGEKIENLKKDIKSLPNHFFGKHEECLHGNEDCKAFKINYRDEVLEKNGIMKPIVDAIDFIAKHSDSLLENQTNNPAEGFNSVLNKLIGGKRINFSRGNSYKLRAYCTVVQYNTQEVLSKIIEACEKEIPRVIKKMEETRQHQRAKVQAHRRENGTTRRPWEGPDEDYGLCKPDMDLVKYDRELVTYKNNLKGNIRRRDEIEMKTRGQSTCLLWKELRKKIITASVMYDVIRAMESKSIERLQKEVVNLYKRIPVNTVHTRRGIETEGAAINRLESLLQDELKKKINIRPCGLVIDLHFPYLGASPDGLIDDDGIIELKCLSARYEKYPDDHECKITITEKHSHYKSFFADDLQAMNKNHKHYYQVQGLLHITGRQYCYFTVYTKFGMHYIKVMKDDKFWEDIMEKPLTEFFEEWFLPELVDSRLERRRQIRIPEKYIQMSEQSPAPTDIKNKGGQNERKKIKNEIKQKQARNKDRKRSLLANSGIIPSKIKKNDSQQETTLPCSKYFGNSINFKPEDGSAQLYYYHLCLYNSFFHGLMTLYEKELNLRQYIDNSNHPYLKTLTNIMNTPEKSEREFHWISYLRKTLPTTFNTEDKSAKDMSGDASEITQKLLTGLNSSVLEYRCPGTCNLINQVEFSIIFARLASNDLSYIPFALNRSMGQNHKQCKGCKKINKRVVTYGNLLVINTAKSGDDLYHNAFKELSLHNVPPELNIATNSYSLKFLIHYRPPASINPTTKSIGHYTCYCLVDSKYVCIDDMQQEKITHVESSMEINPCLIVYWRK